MLDKIIDVQYKFKYDVYCFCCHSYTTVDAELAHKIIDSDEIFYNHNIIILSTLYEKGKKHDFWSYQIPVQSCLKCSNDYSPSRAVDLTLIKITGNGKLTQVYK